MNIKIDLILLDFNLPILNALIKKLLSIAYYCFNFNTINKILNKLVLLLRLFLFKYYGV